MNDPMKNELSSLIKLEDGLVHVVFRSLSCQESDQLVCSTTQKFYEL